MPTRGRIAGLDVVRGIAITLVLARHAWPRAVGGAGIVGVVMFFTLSGYLITGLLVHERSTRGGVDLRRFYLHRFLRLSPPLWLMLVGFVVVTVTLDPAHEAASVTGSLVVALLYFADVPGVGPGAVALGHLWTLAVEEQFYLVWPALVLLALRRGRLVMTACAVSALIYLACVSSLLLARPVYERVYWWPTSWAVALGVGALARIADQRLNAGPLGKVRRRRVAGMVALAALGAACLVPAAKTHAASYLLLGPAVAVCTVGVIRWLVELRTVSTAPLRALVWLGTISYAAYLWDYPLVVWLSPTQDIDPVRGTLSIAATIGLAAVSWYGLERPLSRLRRGSRGEQSRRAVAVDHVA